MELFTLLAPIIIGAFAISTINYRSKYIEAISIREVSNTDIENIKLSQSKLQLLNYFDSTNVGLSD